MRSVLPKQWLLFCCSSCRYVVFGVDKNGQAAVCGNLSGTFDMRSSRSASFFAKQFGRMNERWNLSWENQQRIWREPVLVTLRTPLYGLYLSLETCRLSTVSPDAVVIGTEKLRDSTMLSSVKSAVGSVHKAWKTHDLRDFTPSDVYRIEPSSTDVLSCESFPMCQCPIWWKIRVRCTQNMDLKGTYSSRIIVDDIAVVGMQVSWSHRFRQRDCDKYIFHWNIHNSHFIHKLMSAEHLPCSSRDPPLFEGAIAKPGFVPTVTEILPLSPDSLRENWGLQ